MAQPESKLSRDIMTYLRSIDVWCFKVHGGPTMMAGLPDIIACVPVEVWTTKAYQSAKPEVHGWLIGIETKMPGGEVSEVQALRHEQIRAAGGHVCVAHSVVEVIEWLQTLPVAPSRP